MELIALLLLIIAGGYGYYLQGQSSVKKDIAENEAKILKEQRDNNVTNVDDALSVLKRFKRK